MTDPGANRYKPSIASRISIGRAARLTGLTIRAIRYYEERGLVEAQRNDRDARTFDAAQVERLMQVVELRAIGIPVDDICALAEGDGLPGGAGDNGRLSDLLNEHHQRLLRRLSRIDSVARRAGVQVQGGKDEEGGPSRLSSVRFAVF